MVSRERVGLNDLPQPLALIVVTEDWYFCSHRLPLARQLASAGYRIAVATRADRHRAHILSEGFDLHHVPLLRRGLPSWMEPATVWVLWSLYRRLKPDLVIHVALKPVVLGSLAAWLASVRAAVNILTGMGFVFTSQTIKARLLRFPISSMLRWLLDARGVRVVVQNVEDRDTLTENGILPAERTELVPGSGVDPNHFTPLPEPEGVVTVAAVCRLLGDKGIYDLVGAARILRASGEHVRILLAGPIDPLNPSAIAESEVCAWQSEGLVEWLGPISDVRTVWTRAHIAVLPSHREGLPKALVEAAACGRPIITTNTTGCREVVEDGINGRLVPLRSPIELAKAISEMAKDEHGRRRMGEAGRRVTIEKFSEKVVVGRLVELCRDAVADGRGPLAAHGANLDPKTVQGFGDEWTRYDQAQLEEGEAEELFERYFSIFPWEDLPNEPVGFDMGCGSGRWAKRVAPRVGRLLCVDASADALAVARRNLTGQANCEFLLASVDAMPIPDSSQDFGYSLGVLHHVPDTYSGLAACVRKLKPGAPFLLYLYYSLDNRPLWYRGLWRISDAMRLVISRSPYLVRSAVAKTLAICIYWPLSRVARAAEILGANPDAMPLAYYRRSSLYTMSTDALDRFGTPLERRFSRRQIASMMTAAGLEDVGFSENMPFWVAVGRRRHD